ncbi:MAG: hypothetical protein ACD_48C00543G0003 [uncultured bacterium]|nr:MAG: hypothetical protein ACD_48C00543G0003 [uncultured bacterium]
MITLIHGDDIDASRQALNTFKKEAKSKELRQLDGRSVDATMLTQTLESGSLFGKEYVVIIENLFGKLGKKIKIIESLSTILRKSNSQIILWENKELSATVIKSLGKVDGKLFKTPIILFQFLDSIVPGRKSNALILFQKLETTQPVEIVFMMLFRRIRQLLIVISGSSPEGLQPWQTSRLRTQAKMFSQEKLLDLYRTLLDIEYSIKSGASPFSLGSHIRQFLISL